MKSPCCTYISRYLFLLIGFLINIISYAQNPSTLSINLGQMKQIATVDERYQSYNVEMCEVIGGDFWVPYNLLDSVKKASGKTGFAALKWGIPPINLYETKLRNLAAALGPVYIRVSGTWANATYFQDNDQPKMSNAPAGFSNILTRPQWKGVLDFCKAVNGKLITSFAISPGIRDKDGHWTSDQINALLGFTKKQGGEIYGAEMFNEPSHVSFGDAPKGYKGTDYANDFMLFKKFMTHAAPKVKILGPGSVGEGVLNMKPDIPADSILGASPKPNFEIFTYHFYGNASQRCVGGQKPENALTAEWLSKTELGLDFYQQRRDRYLPNAPIWNTETAETACGGNPWAATFIDCFRYVEQLGRLAKRNVKVVMHNTLARSEYALLDHDTHNPRPNYWAALLWNKLMGTRVYEAGMYPAGIDVFAHNLKGSTTGKCLLIVNTTASTASLNIPKEAQQYLLTADELQTKVVKLNGTMLSLTSKDQTPVINGKKLNPGILILPPQSIQFLAFK